MQYLQGFDGCSSNLVSSFFVVIFHSSENRLKWRFFAYFQAFQPFSHDSPDVSERVTMCQNLLYFCYIKMLGNRVLSVSVYVV